MIALTYDSRPKDQPQLLPCLTRMKLENVLVQGVVKEYIICPRLEQLHFRYALEELEHLSVDGEMDEIEEECSTELLDVFDEEFFEGAPNLKVVSVAGVFLEESFLSNLRPSALLETLVIEDCDIDGLILCFIDYLSTLPSLETIQIVNSWPEHSTVSYPEFIKGCRTERPTVCIYGSGKIESR